MDHARERNIQTARDVDFDTIADHFFSSVRWKPAILL
jgi:hypothetical protein